MREASHQRPHIVDCVFRKRPDQADQRDKKVDWWLPGVGSGERELIAEEYVTQFLLLKNTFIMRLLFPAELRLPCFAWVFCGCGQQGLLSHADLIAAHAGLIAAASPVAENRL